MLPRCRSLHTADTDTHLLQNFRTPPTVARSARSGCSRAALIASHDRSQLQENRSHHFCAPDQLSVGAAEQLSVGAGWAGMVWADVRNAPSKLKSESAPESGSYVR